jgi:hypothetical protein
MRKILGKTVEDRIRGAYETDLLLHIDMRKGEDTRLVPRVLPLYRTG